jgi:hypothetical protein
LNASLGGGDASEIAKFIAQNQYQLPRSYSLREALGERVAACNLVIPPV